MGHRANFVWIENENRTIYYSWAGAKYTLHLLTESLDFCRDFFKKCVEENDLMDTVWCEGALLIDCDKRNIVVFGTEDFNCTPALRRHYFKRIKSLWPDWVITWAHRGIIDIAVYLKRYDERILNVRSLWDYTENGLTFEAMLEDEFFDEITKSEIITLIHNGQIEDYYTNNSLGEGIIMALKYGEKLKDIIPQKYKVDNWVNEYDITSCAVIDYDQKKIFVCWSNVTPLQIDYFLKEHWEDWEIIRQEEGLIYNFKYTHRAYEHIEMTDKMYEENYSMDILKNKSYYVKWKERDK
ncbi:MAG: hypothetical protein U0V72_00845 [Cytophagales bacterium]